MKPRLSFAAAALLTLAGCAHTPTQPQPAPTPPPANLPPITYNGKTLGDLLVAEDAAQRQALDVTMGFYDKAANTTNDPRVMEEATKLATYLDQPERASHLARLWLKREPDNEDALRLAALADIELGDSDAAVNHIDRLIRAHGDRALAPLVAEARNLDNQGDQELLRALSALAPRYPKVAALWYARALDQRQQGNLETAMEAVDHALEDRDNDLQAQLLKGELMFEQGDRDKALDYVKDRVDEHPEERAPRITYVRMLLAERDVKEAENQLRVLAKQNPDDPDLQYSLALIALDSGAPDAAHDILEKLLKAGYNSDEVLLRLGQAAEQNNDPAAAINYYRQVQGDNALRARVQAARLMYATGRSAEGHALIARLIHENPDQADALIVSEADMRANNGDADGAMALLNHALKTQPNNIDLLYARAMAAVTLKDYARMEKDLKKVLDIRPNDAAALNALGYTWADRGQHLQQALDMIQRALQQQPDDPAFLDSMGWALYRLGHLDKAETYLKRALSAYPDPEVANHLAEVLWMNNKKDEARRIWKAALKSHPDSAAIHATLKRLGVSL